MSVFGAWFSYLLLFYVFSLSQASWGAEPKVEIRTPKDGARIAQEQNTILISGKVSTGNTRTANVDIFFVLDMSGSTAHYAGAGLGDANLPAPDLLGSRRSQTGIFGGGVGIIGPPIRDLRNSILAAEVNATRRLLSQLDAKSTRVGLITFGEDAKLLEPLTHDFDRVKQALDEVLLRGPYGGTNMVAGIRLATSELVGIGRSDRRTDAIKVQFFLTDGFPTMPIGRGRKVTLEDTELAINAARIAGKAGIKVHVFALGEEALSYPRAAVGIAEASSGIFTPVVRAADILAVLENLSVVGVNYVEVVNETTGHRASQLRLGADGFFSAAVPVAEGLNRIQVSARSSDGAVGRDSISVDYQRGSQRSLEVEVFLEKERSLELEVKRLGKSREEIEREIDRSRQESLKRSNQPPPATEGAAR
jgi:Mg-chelatase subunit ChlD